MDIKLIKINKNMIVLQGLFNTMSRTLTKDEMQQLVFTDSLKALCSLIARYNSPVYRTKVVFAYLINLLAQVDMRKAEILIEQLNSLCFIGLFGLRISDKHLEFRHICKLYIYSCDVDYLTIYTSIFSDFAVDIEIKNSIINTLVIYINVLCMTEKPRIERQVLEYLEKNKVTVDNLQIKFS